MKLHTIAFLAAEKQLLLGCTQETLLASQEKLRNAWQHTRMSCVDTWNTKTCNCSQHMLTGLRPDCSEQQEYLSRSLVCKRSAHGHIRCFQHAEVLGPRVQMGSQTQVSSAHMRRHAYMRESEKKSCTDPHQDILLSFLGV
jgi:hypothetical protein